VEVEAVLAIKVVQICPEFLVVLEVEVDLITVQVWVLLVMEIKKLEHQRQHLLKEILEDLVVLVEVIEVVAAVEGQVVLVVILVVVLVVPVELDLHLLSPEHQQLMRAVVVVVVVLAGLLDRVEEETAALQLVMQLTPLEVVEVVQTIILMVATVVQES
jgi:hypothetical protein